MKNLNLSYKDFLEHEKQQRFQKYEKRKEKDKIRQKTVRFLERHCNIKKKCQICETEKNVQIHHPNYNDYLKVNFLCKNHHTMLHNFELIPPEIIDLEKYKKERK